MKLDRKFYQTKCDECGSELDNIYVEPADEFVPPKLRKVFERKTILGCPKCKTFFQVIDSRVVIKSEGIMWSHREGMRNLAAAETERGIRRFIRDNVRNKGMFLDVGANLGAHAVGLSRDFGIVVAIEPHPLNVKMMIETIGINDIRNVMVFQMAAWYRPFILRLQRVFPDGFDGWIFTSEKELVPSREDHDFVEVLETPGIPLDNLNLTPSLIKIDVEGVELQVLKGLEKTLMGFHPVVIVEIHTCFGVSADYLREYMKSVGYLKHEVLASYSAENTGRSIDVFWNGDAVDDFDVNNYVNDIMDIEIDHNPERLMLLKKLDIDAEEVSE